MCHSTDLLTVRGVAHLVVHGTSGSTSYETIPHVQLEIFGDVLSTADMVVQRRDGPHRLREIDDDDDDGGAGSTYKGAEGRKGREKGSKVNVGERNTDSILIILSQMRMRYCLLVI